MEPGTVVAEQLEKQKGQEVQKEQKGFLHFLLFLPFLLPPFPQRVTANCTKGS
jgi:hypothetical protein